MQPWTMDILPGVHFNEPEKFAVTAFTPDQVKYIITHFVGNYTKFQSYMDGFRAEGMHNAAHLMLQGWVVAVNTPSFALITDGAQFSDMADLSHSPNDPIFFLHHAVRILIIATPSNTYILCRIWIVSGPTGKPTILVTLSLSVVEGPRISQISICGSQDPPLSLLRMIS